MRRVAAAPPRFTPDWSAGKEALALPGRRRKTEEDKRMIELSVKRRQNAPDLRKPRNLRVLLTGSSSGRKIAYFFFSGDQLSLNWQLR